MQVKLLLVNFYFNGGLHAVFIVKLSERMSNFWTIWFSETESEQNFCFPHMPNRNVKMVACCVVSVSYYADVSLCIC